MIRLMYGEEFREIKFPESFRKRYAISNKGRLVSFKEDPLKDGKIITGGKNSGYKVFKYARFDENNEKVHHFYYFAKLVALAFLEQPSPEHTHVVHKDFDRTNDVLENLKFVTRAEMYEHIKNSPKVKQAKKNRIGKPLNRQTGSRLTSTQVIRLKKILADPTRKIKPAILAKQFNISQSHLSNIKKGKKWYNITIPENGGNDGEK